MKTIERIKTSIKRRGLLETIMLIPKKYLFRYKLRMYNYRERVDIHEMDGSNEIKKHAVEYQPSDQVLFKKIFDNLDWHFQNSTFIDIGCGKGITLVSAAKLGFKKVIGVEFSPQLAAIALSNMNIFSKQIDGKIEFEIVNIDGAKYEIPIEADCFYFFNPFDDFILNQVLEKIINSLKKKYRKILIIYLNPLHRKVIEKYSFTEVYSYGGAIVYTNLLVPTKN